MEELDRAKENFLLIDNNLSKYARKSLDYHRLKEENIDIRTPFARDTDRIIHSLSYTRYMDKTQVYSFKNNDHISKRIIHVQFVSKIARTIGRALCLNTDLIEAIALGHDIGHTPLGHFGESVLNEISLSEMGEYFSHNIQSVRHYLCIDNNGCGLNLCVETLDGIMCHNGEMVSYIYKPIKKTIDEVFREYKESYSDIKKSRTYSSMTLEGCVVRISDIIAYLGRDIEDSIELGLFKRDGLPESIVKTLGNNNRDIINNITLDIIKNSMDKPYIKMSEEVYNAIKELKKFNCKNLYDIAMSEEEKDYYREGINKLYKKYLNDIEKCNKKSIIYKLFLDNKVLDYINNTSDKRMVIDFISGMTDKFLKNEIKKLDLNN